MTITMVHWRQGKRTWDTGSQSSLDATGVARSWAPRAVRTAARLAPAAPLAVVGKWDDEAHFAGPMRWRRHSRWTAEGKSQRQRRRVESWPKPARHQSSRSRSAWRRKKSAPKVSDWTPLLRSGRKISKS